MYTDDLETKLKASRTQVESILSKTYPIGTPLEKIEENNRKIEGYLLSIFPETVEKIISNVTGLTFLTKNPDGRTVVYKIGTDLTGQRAVIEQRDINVQKLVNSKYSTAPFNIKPEEMVELFEDYNSSKIVDLIWYDNLLLRMDYAGKPQKNMFEIYSKDHINSSIYYLTKFIGQYKTEIEKANLFRNLKSDLDNTLLIHQVKPTPENLNEIMGKIENEFQALADTFIPKLSSLYLQNKEELVNELIEFKEFLNKLKEKDSNFVKLLKNCITSEYLTLISPVIQDLSPNNILFLEEKDNDNLLKIKLSSIDEVFRRQRDTPGLDISLRLSIYEIALGYYTGSLNEIKNAASDISMQDFNKIETSINSFIEKRLDNASEIEKEFVYNLFNLGKTFKKVNIASRIGLNEGQERNDSQIRNQREIREELLNKYYSTIYEIDKLNSFVASDFDSLKTKKKNLELLLQKLVDENESLDYLPVKYLTNTIKNIDEELNSIKPKSAKIVRIIKK